MATIAEQLTSLSETKTAIKDAIVAKGVQVADDTPFRNYADKVGEISGGGEPVEKTKFGASVDNFLGDVDADGSYISPVEDFVLDLTGVKSIKAKNDNRGFSQSLYGNKRCVGVIGNDLVDSDLRDCFGYMCAYCTNLSVFEFNSLETIMAQGMFSCCNYYGNPNLVPHFNKLKSIKSYDSTFKYAFNSAKIEPDETFPLLEYVSGNSQLSDFRQISAGDVIVFSKIRTIVGSTSMYSGTFGSIYAKNTVWKFPSATEFTGYIWQASTSYPGEIHFAAANQAAIEACDGYANKWGFAGASLFFDL